MKIDKKFREQLVLIVQTGALTFDKKYQKTMAHALVDAALNMPKELFSEKDYSVHNYATDLLDFHYGHFDIEKEEYPEWITNYFEWKSKGVRLPRNK